MLAIGMGAFMAFRGVFDTGQGIPRKIKNHPEALQDGL